MKTLSFTPWMILFLLLILPSPAGAVTHVGTKEDLMDALAFENADVQLTGDIDLGTSNDLFVLNSGATIDGNGRSITSQNPGLPVFVIPQDRSNITLRNLTLSGESLAPFTAEKLSNFHLEDVLFKKNISGGSTLDITTVTGVLASGTIFLNNENAKSKVTPKGSSLHLKSSPDADFSNAKFIGNTTTSLNQSAAGAYIHTSDNADFSGSEFTNNASLFMGVSPDPVNEASEQIGAAAIVQSHNVNFSNSTFTGNTANNPLTGHGGALNITESNGTILTNTTFTNNRAVHGGAIYLEKASLDLTPAAAEYIRFTTATDTLYVGKESTLNIGGAGRLQFGGAVTAETGLTTDGAVVTAQINVDMDGGTIYLGTSKFTTTPAWTAAGLTVAAGSGSGPLADASSRTGSGAALPYFTMLKSFHLGDNSILALDMNYAGNADLPYFMLDSGVTATTGTNTTLYGLIGANLAAAESNKTFTYTVFSGSAGDANAFAPASYTTSSTLVNLANPTYYADSGTFTVDVVRTGAAPTDPSTPEDPGAPGDFNGMFPADSLHPDLDRILGSDYLYNPSTGTLLGQNPLLDGIFFRNPDGSEALTKDQRLTSLTSAQHAGMLAGGQDILRSTLRHQRSRLFSSHIASGGTSLTFSLGTDSNIRWGEDNRILFAAAVDPEMLSLNAAPDTVNRASLWATPLYGYERGKDFSLYNSGASSLRNKYTSSVTGALLGTDVRFGDEGQYLAGTMFTAARGQSKTSGDFMRTTNDADIFGLTLFGRWRPAAGWDLGLYAGVLKADNDVKQSNIINLDGSFDSVTWQTGLTARYEHAIGNDGKRRLFADFGTELQYYRQDSLTMSQGSQAIGRMGKTDSTTLEFPLLFGLKDTFEFENGSRLTLEGRAGYRLTTGDLRLSSAWSIPGGQYSASVSGNKLDRHVGTLGTGILWEKDRLSLSLDYDAEVGSHRLGHQLSGQVMWKF